MGSGYRASYWTRWPDEEQGPLWVGLHLNDRGGETVLVGLEVYTEPPATARRTLGPEGDPADEFLPWPPSALLAADLQGLGLADLVGRFVHDLRVRPGLDAADEGRLQAVDRRRRGGRPPLYPPIHWRAVAAAYTAAVAAGRLDPTVAVAQRFTVSRSAAAKWVARCRAQGLLPPATAAPRR